MDMGYVTRCTVGTCMGEIGVTMTCANMGHMRIFCVILEHWGLCLDHSRTHMDLGIVTKCSVGTWMGEKGVTMT